MQFEDYKDCFRESDICSYMSEGDIICGQGATNSREEPDLLRWRCLQCLDKTNSKDLWPLMRELDDITREEYEDTYDTPSCGHETPGRVCGKPPAPSSQLGQEDRSLWRCRDHLRLCNYIKRDGEVCGNRLPSADKPICRAHEGLNPLAFKLSIAEYIETPKGCSYSPPRGENQGYVCGGQVISDNPSRCSMCQNRMGVFKKRRNLDTGG